MREVLNGSNSIFDEKVVPDSRRQLSASCEQPLKAAIQISGILFIGQVKNFGALLRQVAEGLLSEGAFADTWFAGEKIDSTADNSSPQGLV